MPNDLEDWTDVAAGALRNRFQEVMAEELRRMRQEAPEFFTSDDPDFVESYTSSCRAHLTTILDGLHNGRDIPSVLPPAAVAETRAIAEWGISLDSSVQTYRTAHAVIWEFAMDVVYQFVPTTFQSSVLKVISRYLFSYADRMVALMTELYEHERTSLFQDRDRQRRQLVRDLLDGLPIDHSRLPYNLDTTHVAAITTGEFVDREIARMKMAVGFNSLVVGGPQGTKWIWFGGAGLATPDGLRRLIAVVSDGFPIAFGEPADGVQGFRSTHMEARQTNRIGRITTKNVLRYSEVALLALVTVDEVSAKHFMERELGFLTSGEPRVKELRDTLAAYFETGQNASATAAKLSLNDRTVAYRLRSIEQRLGRPILERRGELAIALQIRDLYSVEHRGTP